MLRHRVAPVVLNAGMATTFAISLSVTSLFSTGVHQSGDTAYTMLACAALVLVVSQSIYYGLTLLQLLYARAQQYARARRPDPLPCAIESRHLYRRSVPRRRPLRRRCAT